MSDRRQDSVGAFDPDVGFAVEGTTLRFLRGLEPIPPDLMHNLCAGRW